MFHYLVRDGAMRAGLVLLILWECTGCAVAHHVQLGDIDSTTEVKRFEIKVSESTVNVTGALGVASVIAKNPSVQKKLRDAMVLVALFQMGPRTGLGVYNDIYAEQLLALIIEACPNGRITGITSIRETRRYPLVSGEIVKVVGFCQI